MPYSNCNLILLLPNYYYRLLVYFFRWISFKFRPVLVLCIYQVKSQELFDLKEGWVWILSWNGRIVCAESMPWFCVVVGSSLLLEVLLRRAFWPERLASGVLTCRHRYCTLSSVLEAWKSQQAWSLSWQEVYCMRWDEIEVVRKDKPIDRCQVRFLWRSFVGVVNHGCPHAMQLPWPFFVVPVISASVGKQRLLRDGLSTWDSSEYGHPSDQTTHGV
jgi:hypothetical protein